VANGDNADWLRKDLRSGMLNLNLIIDEEVFYGLIDDPRLSTVPAYTSSTAAALPQNGVPQLITAISADGTPTFHYPMSDLSAHPYGRGFLIVTPPAFWPLDTVNGNPIPLSAMKAAFADFIKLRHGGSGYLGGVRNVQAPVAYPNAVGNLLPEKPFRSFTTFLPNGASPPNPFLSIYDTLMRPAKLGAVTGDVATMPAVEMDVRRNPGDPADLRWFNRTELPPRMLFQLPFYDDPANPNDDSPASEIPMTDRSASPATYAAANDHPFLSNRNANLFDSATDIDNTTDASLGWNGGGPGADRRRHPYWQTEILQKISNNTTVRTHQFAVWVTVGLFEVVLEGDSSKVLIDPNLAVDQLGKEIGRDAGTAVRYRAFFIVDRTRAFGFDPNNPDDFRPLVVYRKRIE
jgi:hypothetical protein